MLQSNSDDQGPYTCTVTDHAHNKQDKTVFVPILEADQPRLLVYYEGFQTIDRTIGVDEQKEVQWVVQIDSHPQPMVQW